MKRWPVLVSFVLFVLLCISITYWAMQLFKPQARPVAAAPQTGNPIVNLDAAASLFGGRAAAVAVASNFQLKGVVAANKTDESIAVLAADGKPTQAVRLNAEVMPGVIVKEVHPQYVLLSEGGITKRVELPEGAKPLTQVDVATITAPRTNTMATNSVPPPAFVPPASLPITNPSQNPAGDPIGTPPSRRGNLPQQ